MESVDAETAVDRRVEMIGRGLDLKAIWREEFDLAARTPDADRTLMWARIASRFLGDDTGIAANEGGAWKAQERRSRRRESRVA